MKKALIDTYSKEEFQNLINNSSSYSELALKLGYKAKSGDLIARIKQRIQELDLQITFKEKTPVKRTVENIFIENSTADQRTLRDWFIKGQYQEYKCSICGLEPIWNGKELTLILDHINGRNKDNQLHNLRWVCPNCNQQLSTTGWRGSKNY